MTPPDEQLPHDQQLAELYRRMRQPEPSPLLDTRIRKQARRELRRHYWPPLAAAAVLVLGITIALHLFNMDYRSPGMHEPSPAGDAVSSETTSEGLSADKATAAPAAGGARQPAPAESLVRRFQATQAKPQALSLPAAPERLQEGEAGSDMHESTATRSTTTGDLADALAPCGQADLHDNRNPAAWQQRIRELRATGQTKTAECLVKQFAHRFDGD